MQNSECFSFLQQLVKFKLNAEFCQTSAESNPQSGTESGRDRERVGERERERHAHTQVFALGLTNKRINAIKFFPCFIHFILRLPSCSGAGAANENVRLSSAQYTKKSAFR